MNFIQRLINRLFGTPQREKETQTTETYSKEEKQVEEVHSIWDYIKFVEQTQAHHICSVIGFEEWVAMEEIFRRVKEIFGVEYKNERSLYPYIKTLVDCGLVENMAVGGKMKWRKKEVLIKIKKQATQKAEDRLTAEQATVKAT